MISSVTKRSPTYAILLRLDDCVLRRLLEANDLARDQITHFFAKQGFVRRNHDLYFGDQTVDAVQCVLTAQRLAATFNWVVSAIKEIRMLRIEEDCDLTGAFVDIDTQSHSRSVMAWLDPANSPHPLNARVY